jgi:hypothetical protein
VPAYSASGGPVGRSGGGVLEHERSHELGGSRQPVARVGRWDLPRRRWATTTLQKTCVAHQHLLTHASAVHMKKQFPGALPNALAQLRPSQIRARAAGTRNPQIGRLLQHTLGSGT